MNGTPAGTQELTPEKNHVLEPLILPWKEISIKKPIQNL